ncbi:MAG TPA: hypothetical protein DCM38_01655, partial [Gammaproteobacteria bacterium]|nr:hypothetical protein [Gammaproteobacteria bacterium]
MKFYVAKLLSVLGRFYPLYSGCGNIANSKFCRWALEQTSEPAWICLRHGAWMLTPMNDYNGRALFYFGEIDPKITWICKQILRQGDTVLDMGANLGLYSIISREIVGSSGQVHAFEPQPTLVELMRQSLEKNDYSDVVIHNLALGEEKKTAVLLIPVDNLGAASLIRQSDQPCD